jgi:hypothetical protein
MVRVLQRSGWGKFHHTMVAACVCLVLYTSKPPFPFSHFPFLSSLLLIPYTAAQRAICCFYLPTAYRSPTGKMSVHRNTITLP